MWLFGERIHVGPGGLWLVLAGAMFWFGIDPIDLPAQAARYIGAVGAALGAASVLTWLSVLLWRKVAR